MGVCIHKLIAVISGAQKIFYGTTPTVQLDVLIRTEIGCCSNSD